MGLSLSRQSKLVPEETLNQYTHKVFGIGSVGSHLVKTLVKTGAENIEVFDMDTVEKENLAAQCFDSKYVHLPKVLAIYDIAAEAGDIEILYNHGQITEETDITPEPNTIYYCLFDSLQARQMVFEKLKGYPVVFIDGRIGKYHMRHYLVECDDEKQVEDYLKTLAVTAVSELECGEKACAPINIQIAGKIIMNMINYINGNDYIKTYIGNASMPTHDINVVVTREVPESDDG